MLRKFIPIFIISISTLFSEETFNLKDGSSIKGDRISEDEKSITVQSAYGQIIIKKDDLVIKEYQVILKSGETLVGIINEDNNEYIVLKTKNLGLLKFSKDEISSIQEINQDNPDDDKDNNYQGGVLGLINPTGIVDNILSNSKDVDFTEGQEQLISLFSDPTAHTLKRSTLYMSGFSFGVGLTDDLQITTRWSSFFYGDLNLRFKYKIYSTGNWKKQSTLAIGVDYHQRWRGDKYKWISGSGTEQEIPYYYGGYVPITATEEDIEIDVDQWCLDNQAGDCSVTAYDNSFDPDKLDYMFELFGAYTFSKARSNLKGQITHTVGARLFIPRIDNGKKWELLPRLYYGVDFDITPRFKILTSIIYDEYMLEPYQGGGFFSSGELDISKVNHIEEENPLPVHLDFGFVYALNNNFRFGIHFQKPWIGFYWKF